MGRRADEFFQEDIGVADRIHREAWDRFRSFYEPMEDAMIERAMQTDFTAERNEAGATALAQTQASRGTLARNLGRAGMKNLSPEMNRAISRRFELNKTRNIARAENVTGQVYDESRNEFLRSAAVAGQGVAAGAMQMYDSAANMAAQRKQNYMGERAQRDASHYSNIATGLGVLTAFI